MIDHSVQIGQCKCLVILGIRLSEFPAGRPLCHQDMELIALVPMTSSTQQTVAACLEDAVARTGVPRAILDDHGSDLHGGVEIFREAHPETSELYDIKHKAACLLKARLGGRRAVEIVRQPIGADEVRGTADGVGVSDAPEPAVEGAVHERGRAGGMGAEDAGVGGRTVAVLERLGISAERVRAKLGWLGEFRAALAEWSDYQEVIDEALDFVRHRGLYLGAGFAWRRRCQPDRGAAANCVRN